MEEGQRHHERRGYDPAHARHWAGTTRLNRETQDAQADLEEAHGKPIQELGNKMMAIVEKYATQNAFAPVRDDRSPASRNVTAEQTIGLTDHEGDGLSHQWRHLASP